MSEIFNPHITLYTGVSDKKGAERIFSEQLFFIRNAYASKLSQQIEAVRNSTGTERDELKKQLPAVTWSGTFTARKKDGLKEYSHVICHDLDKLEPEELTRLKKEFAADSNIYACFTSPSGNGLKLLFIVETGAEEHTDMFNAIGAYLVHHYGVVFDPSCKDISRLCFLSYDPQMSVQDEPVKLGIDFFNQWTIKKKKTQVGKAVNAQTIHETATASALFQKCHAITAKTQSATPGSYNAYINVFSLQANRYGIDISETIHELQNGITAEHDHKDTEKVVRSNYAQFANEFDKYNKDKVHGGSKTGSKGGASLTPPAPGEPGEYDETVLFWDKFKKGEDAETGKEIFEYKHSYQKTVRFLMNNGFGKIRLENNNYKFVRIQDNIVEEVNERLMKEFMLGYLNRDIAKNNQGKYEAKFDELYLVREMFLKGSKTYCSTEKFESLDYLDNLQFKTDTATGIYFYFKNCFVEVTKDGFTQQPYTQLKGLIWKRQIVDREFKSCEKSELANGEFRQFIAIAVCGAETEGDGENKVIKINSDEKAKQKFDSARSAIGYSISRYKNRAIAKAIVLVDKKLRHGGNESNGGSGKGIFFTGISKARNSINIDGKTFRFDANFPYTMINEDHEFVHFEDVKKGFDIEMLFNPITGGWEIRRLHENSYQIPFERSAKIGISTNFSLKGTGSSFLRRQHIIELSNFFNDKYSPLDHFGHLLFDDWNEQEWNLFYNFEILCCQLYLSKGLIDFPLENYHTNKLVDAAGEEFVDWMDEQFGVTEGGASIVVDGSPLGIYAKGVEYERNAIFEAFKKDFPNNKLYQNMTRTNTFTGWVNEWCNQRGLELISSKSGSKYKWKFV